MYFTIDVPQAFDLPVIGFILNWLLRIVDLLYEFLVIFVVPFFVVIGEDLELGRENLIIKDETFIVGRVHVFHCIKNELYKKFI